MMGVLSQKILDQKRLILYFKKYLNNVPKIENI